MLGGASGKAAGRAADGRVDGIGALLPLVFTNACNTDGSAAVDATPSAGVRREGRGLRNSLMLGVGLVAANAAGGGLDLAAVGLRAVI